MTGAIRVRGEQGLQLVASARLKNIGHPGLKNFGSNSRTKLRWPLRIPEGSVDFVCEKIPCTNLPFQILGRIPSWTRSICPP